MPLIVLINLFGVAWFGGKATPDFQKVYLKKADPYNLQPAHDAPESYGLLLLRSRPDKVHQLPPHQNMLSTVIRVNHNRDQLISSLFLFVNY